MSRIRTLKPEFFRSPSTAKADFPVRIFYQALWCWADDFGIGETNINGLLGFAFPDDDEFTAQDLRRFCADVAQHFDVAFYTVRGRHYFAIPSWDQHQKTERRSERRKNPGPDDPDAVRDQRFYPCADIAPEVRRENGADSRESSAGTGEQGNRGTGEQDDDARLDEPPPDDEPPAEVVDIAPAFIDNPSRPSKRHASSAAKTLVRQTLGNAYPRATVERLGVQVDKLLAEKHPDTLVRDAVAEWDRRPNCDKPEFLPTVYGDVVKRTRAAPGIAPGEAKVLAWAELGNPDPEQRKALER